MAPHDSASAARASERTIRSRHLEQARGAHAAADAHGDHHVLRAAALARELGLDAWLVGSGRDAERIEELRAANRPLLLPLRFPDKPKAPKEGERGPELDELRAWALAPEAPAKLIAAGLEVSFTTHRLDDPKGAHAATARAMNRGLGAAEALAAWSSTPA